MDKMYEVEFYFIFLGFLVLIKGLLADFKRRLLIIERTCRIFDSFFVEAARKAVRLNGSVENFYMLTVVTLLQF